jgi:hypothetical protein
MNAVEQESQLIIQVGIGGADTKGSRAKCRKFRGQRSFGRSDFAANLLYRIES